MVLVDGEGTPLGAHLDSASPAEVSLLETTLKKVSLRGARPDRLILDRGYDSDPLRERMARRGIEMIAPHRQNRTKPPTQDGRPLCRYRRRWIVERTFAWLGNFRRLLVTYAGFFHLACALLTLRRVLK